MIDLTFQDPKSLVNRAAFNERFSVLNGLYQYWWKRKSLNELYGISISDEIHVSYREGYQEHFITVMEKGDDSYSLSVQYSDGVELSGNKVVLKQPISTKKVSINNVETSAAFLRGKYFKPAAYEGYSDYPYEDRVTYVMPDASFSSTQGSGGGAYYIFASNVKEVSSELVESGAIDYVQSNDRSAYPDSGEQNNYEYQFLGIPFENAREAPKVAIGSYIGTGKFGQDSPNSITFEKGTPYLVIITTSGAVSGQIIGLFVPKTLPSSYVQAAYRMLSDNGVISSDMYAKVDGNTLYWYSTAMNFQLNTKDTYDYYAFY